MDHFWRTIPGFFTFPDFYEHLARLPGPSSNSKPGKHIVEVGAYFGQSAAFLAVELDRHCGPLWPKLDLVDVFQSGVEPVARALEPVKHVIGAIHQAVSWQAASAYADGTLDAVFIDADHSYPSVSRDIDAWRPKVRTGGVLAGHDFTLEFPGVMKAVTERFDRFEIWRGTNDGGDERMQGKYYPVWCVTIP